MICPVCGRELPDGSAFCSGCGARVNVTENVQKDEFFEDVRPAKSTPPPSTNTYQPVQNAAPRPVQPAAQNAQPAKLTGTNTIAVVGFILAFFFALPGLICSIMGLKKSKEYEGENGRGLAIAGIVLSAISLVVSFFIGFFWGIALVEAIIGSTYY